MTGSRAGESAVQRAGTRCYLGNSWDVWLDLAGPASSGSHPHPKGARPADAERLRDGRGTEGPALSSHTLVASIEEWPTLAHSASVMQLRSRLACRL